MIIQAMPVHLYLLSFSATYVTTFILPLLRALFLLFVFTFPRISTIDFVSFEVSMININLTPIQLTTCYQLNISATYKRQ